MKGLVVGLGLAPAAILLLLSIRPGGLRRQLRLAARRLRLALVLAGFYLAAAVAIRVAFPAGPVATWGPPALAVVLAAVFVVLAAEPRAGGRPEA